MEYKFKPGDRVRIRKGSEHYGGPSNPPDTSGTLRLFDGHTRDYFYSVKWDNGTDNQYRDEDLELDQPYINEQKLKRVLGLNNE